MSWQCTSWALREAPCPSASARLILIALADRCKPDGRSAWPTVETLMQEAHCSGSTVRRALRDLEDAGAIRRGDQELAARDEHGRYLVPQYRPIVWECCMGVTLERIAEKPGSQARVGRDGRDRAAEGIHGGRRSQTCQNDSTGEPRDSNDSQTSQNDSAGIENDSRPVTGDIAGTVTSDKSYKETNNITNTPLRSPHGGCSRQEDEPDKSREPASALERMFTALRDEQGLQAPLRKERGRASDMASARALLSICPIDEVIAVASWAMTDRFWRSNVLTLSALKRNWEQITLQRSRRGQGDRGAPVPVRSGPVDRDLNVETEFGPILVHGGASHGRAACLAHLEDAVPQSKCPLCGLVGRNQADHGRLRAQREVREMLKTPGPRFAGSGRSVSVGGA